MFEGLTEDQLDAAWERAYKVWGQLLARVDAIAKLATTQPALYETMRGDAGRLLEQGSQLSVLCDQLATEMERRGTWPFTGADMACTTCGKPAVAAGSADAWSWVHQDQQDFLDCPVPGGQKIQVRVNA